MGLVEEGRGGGRDGMRGRSQRSPRRVRQASSGRRPRQGPWEARRTPGAARAEPAADPSALPGCLDLLSLPRALLTDPPSLALHSGWFSLCARWF